MTDQLFGKGLAVTIALLFVFLMLTPVIESISFQHNTLAPPRDPVPSKPSQYRETNSLIESPIPAVTTAEHSYVNHQSEIEAARGYFYAYCGYDPSGGGSGPITFDSPNNIELLAPGIFPNFCSGADIDAEENWYGCDYAGGLYLIDLETGLQTYISTTIGINGMTVDPTTGTWYVTSTNCLYTIDVYSGATTFLGPLDSSQGIIDISCNIHGQMYGFGYGYTEESILYRINKTTGQTTVVGNMGEYFYGASCCFDRNNDILYIAGYPQSSLYTCDTDTGLVTILGDFEGAAEIDGLAIPWSGNLYDHDIGVPAIIQPVSGDSRPITPVVKVKNNGMTNEINIPIQLEINKEQLNEYNQTLIIPSLDSGEIIELSFPEWIPSDLGVVENIDITYTAEATNLFVDNNTENDYVEKEFTLHYGYLHDVALTQIISPISGPAQTQIPEVTVENHGQNTETAYANMIIGKASYSPLMEEDFSSGVPPAGWGTNYPQNWYSSSTNYAGGVAPEAQFSWTPSSIGEHYLWTNNIDTTSYTTASLRFKEYVYDYNSDYSLKVVTSTDGGATWNDAYIRAGGPYGPATTEVTLTEANGIGSATFKLAWDLSGDSFNINYWYIDDVFLGTIEIEEEYNQTISLGIETGETIDVSFPEWTPLDLPLGTTMDYLIHASVSMNLSDESPLDNDLAEIITLSYIHDVGVLEITEPAYSPKQGYCWDNYPDDGSGIGISSQLDVDYPFNAQVADDFQFTSTSMDIVKVHWWGSFWNGVSYPNPTGFNIIFYLDSGSGTMPTGAGMDDPTSTALAVYHFPAVLGTMYGVNKYEYEVTLDTPFAAYFGQKYWITIQEVAPYATSGFWGWSTNGANPDQLSIPRQGFPVQNIPYWTTTSHGDMAFRFNGHVHSYHWPSGTYNVTGIVKNYGSFIENSFSVNTKITWLDYNQVIYDETVTVSENLFPNQTILTDFPDVTFNVPNDELFTYKLEMKTMLPGDDNLLNDNQLLFFSISGPGLPPETHCYLSGQMGQNNWFISNVTVTLSMADKPWPNHTYYKIDEGDWIEYTSPFSVSEDGPHTISYYSTYTDGYIEPEKHASFKIDQTAPSITMSAEKVGFRQWVFTATGSDETSGMAFVQCYIDDMWLGNITTPGPYQWNWKGKGNHTVIGIAYDIAGNSAENDVVFSFALSELFSQRSWAVSLLGKIIQRILSFFPIFQS
jgi:CARDB